MTEKPDFLETAHGTRIAYHRVADKGDKGSRRPGVIFLGGFMSDMEGSKALALEAWCRAEDYAFVRFDYMGHGRSSGRFDGGTISKWLADALAVIDQLSEGPQILVGSSMGGWLALLAARELPERVAGLVGIAAAPDFTKRHWDELSAKDRQTIIREGRLLVASDYGPDPYVFTRDLFEDGADNCLLDKSYPHEFPVRLIQGTDDPDVPWQTATDLAAVMTGGDCEILLVPGGDHRLSEPADLKRLIRVVGELAAAPTRALPDHIESV